MENRVANTRRPHEVYMRSLESVTSYFKMGGGGSFELVNIRRADNANIRRADNSKPNILQKWFKDAQRGKTILGIFPPGRPSPPGGLQTPQYQVKEQEIRSVSE